MRKLVIALAALFVTISANAQFGIVAGLTSTHTDLEEAYADIKDVNKYHAGIVYNIKLPLGLSIQPGLLYNVKGSSYTDVKENGEKVTVDFKSGNLELPVRVAWGFNILFVKPFVFAEPFLGYTLNNNITNSNGDVVKVEGFDKSKFNYGVSLGAGVLAFKHVGLTVKYYWNLGQAFDGNASFDKDTFAGLKTQNANGVLATLAIYF